MRTGIWHTRWIAIGLMPLIGSGCQAPPPQNTAAKAPQQTVSKLPAGPVELKEGPAPEIFPDTHVAAGRLHESQGKLARAAEQYRLAIGAQPKHVEAHNRLGVVLDGLGKFNEADRAFGRAIELAPRQAHLHNNLAFSYILQGRWAEAQAELTKALELQPDFPRAQVNLATALAQQGRFEEALENFRRVLRPEDAYYNLGLMYQSKRHPVEAAQAFKQALQASPKMIAAKKRLEVLPPAAVAEAGQRGALFAFPVALTGKSGLQNAPATRPAGDMTAQGGGSDQQGGQAADAETLIDSEVQATQPADADIANDGDPYVERSSGDEWLFSRLGMSGPGAAQQAGGLADSVSGVRGALESISELLARIQSVQMGETDEETSPLPPEVPPPDPEPATDDVKASGSKTP